MSEIKDTQTQTKVTKFLKANGFNIGPVSVLALTACGLSPDEIRVLGIPQEYSKQVIKQAMKENGFKTQKQLTDYLIKESEEWHQMNLGTRTT